MRLETQGHYKTHCEWYKSHPAYEIFYCSPPVSRLEQKTRLIASKASYAGEKNKKRQMNSMKLARTIQDYM